MSYNLTDSDYKKILEYYNTPIPRSKRLLKKNAEDIIALKLCSCIKKVNQFNKTQEARSIGICTRTVVKTKGLKRGTFKCLKKRQVELSKPSRKNIVLGTKTANKTNKTNKTRKSRK